MSFVVVSVVALLFAFVGSLPLAGPIALLVVSNGVNGRYREALGIAFGAALAEGIYAFLAFWGFATFLARYALVLPISQAITATILLALGVRFAFFALKEREAEVREPKPGRFWVGFSISALNPTLLATWGAVTTFLYSNQIVHFAPVLAVPFGAFTAVGVGLWGLMTVAILRHFRSRISSGMLAWAARVMGVVLIAVAVWSALGLVRYLAGGGTRHPGSAVGEAARESICMREANRWRILRPHERVPLRSGCRHHDRRGLRGRRNAGSLELA
jgi:threonine/homoserine/homoserine lactone efflux protein